MSMCGAPLHCKNSSREFLCVDPSCASKSRIRRIGGGESMAHGRWVLCIALLASVAVSAGHAQDTESMPDPYALQIHGFISPGFMLSTGNNYLAKTRDGSFEFAETGINFTKPLTDELRLGVQLFARDLG